MRREEPQKRLTLQRINAKKGLNVLVGRADCEKKGERCLKLADINYLCGRKPPGNGGKKEVMNSKQKNIESKSLELYQSYTGAEPKSIERLAGAGSDRVYWRLGAPNTETLICAYGPDRAENRTFISLADYFRKRGMNVPQILAVSEDGYSYLQTDLGTTSLFSLLGTDRFEPLCRETMKSLVKLQTLPKEEWSSLTNHAPFSRRQIMWDLNYFKYDYLKPTGIVFDENALEDDFESLSRKLLEIPPALSGFMYRDCQSRNVMIIDDEPYWIDFQGGRVGPCLYDAVSFLWQAKAALTDDFREKMLDIYATEYSRVKGIDKTQILSLIPRFVLFRTLQVLGAYGFRGLIEHRAHFIESIPGALSNLRRLVERGEVNEFPELKRICKELIDDGRFAPQTSGRLRVEVFSFSYKRGYPADYSGNGGGYMFDCRAMHNPGRYAEYKLLTGRDESVRTFLEERGEVQPFLAHAWELTDRAVRRYLERNFTSLQIGFGCTGGRHRSVYCAEATARHLARLFPEAEIILNHREQNIRELLTP